MLAEKSIINVYKWANGQGEIARGFFLPERHCLCKGVQMDELCEIRRTIDEYCPGSSVQVDITATREFNLWIFLGGFLPVCCRTLYRR